jgi:hypothetical protein
MFHLPHAQTEPPVCLTEAQVKPPNKPCLNSGTFSAPNGAPPGWNHDRLDSFCLLQAENLEVTPEYLSDLFAETWTQLHTDFYL